MKKFFFTLIVSAFCCCCKDSMPKVASKYLIEYDDNNYIDVKNIVSDIQIIELDTALEAKMPSISTLSIFNNCIYCFTEDDGGYINVFDMNGKFLNSLKKRGRAQNEWIQLYNMFINPQDSCLVLSDDETKRTLLYKYDGTFMRSYKFTNYDSWDMGYDHGLFYSVTDLFYASSKITSATKHMLNIYDENGHLINKAVRVKHIGTRFDQDTFTRLYWGTNALLLAPTMDETIYEIDSCNVFPYATFKYNGKQIFYTDGDVKKAIKEGTWLGQKAFYSGSVVESPQYIIRRIGYSNAFDVIYDKENNKAYTTMFNNNELGKKHLSDYILYPQPYCYYNGRYYSRLQSMYLELPEDYFDGHLPDNLKPYVEKAKNGTLNNLIVSYKIHL